MAPIRPRSGFTGLEVWPRRHLDASMLTEHGVSLDQASMPRPGLDAHSSMHASIRPRRLDARAQILPRISPRIPPLYPALISCPCIPPSHCIQPQILLCIPPNILPLYPASYPALHPTSYPTSHPTLVSCFVFRLASRLMGGTRGLLEAWGWHWLCVL